MTKRYRQYFDRYSTQLLLVVVLLVFSLLMAWRSDFFITGKNIKNILEASTFRLILA